MTTQDELRTMVVAYGDVLDGALEPSGPRAGADSGDPQTSGVAFFEGHGVSVGVWECTPGGWAITDRPDTETMMLLGGRRHASPPPTATRSTSSRATSSSCPRAGPVAGTSPRPSASSTSPRLPAPERIARRRRDSTIREAPPRRGVIASTA